MKVIRTQDAVGGRTDDFPALGMLFRAFLKSFIFRNFLNRKFSQLGSSKKMGFLRQPAFREISMVVKDFYRKTPKTCFELCLKFVTIVMTKRPT